MKLTEMTLPQFSEILASDAPAPGGGSVAALNAAVGAALIHMVCALTVGKEKYAEHEESVRNIKSGAETLISRSMSIVDSDTDAFNEVTNVFSMPKNTDEEKAARSAAMQSALKSCTVTPFNVMICASEALTLVSDSVDKLNKNAASDIGVAVLNLKTAVQSAWLNVLINLGGIKDAEFVNSYRSKGEEILAEALPIADKIYEETLAIVSS
jgi:formiminotetrahydrofolate cyclodeaminase